MNADFISSVKADIASTTGFELILAFFPPASGGLGEYTVMENTLATSGPSATVYSMGKSQGDGTLSNVDKYSFVGSNGTSFTSPFSSASNSPYTAKIWTTQAGSGTWNAFAKQQGAGSTSSIGSMYVEYCGVCN